jgi:hypothetical protein
MQDLISKNPIKKTGLMEWLKMKALSSNLSTTHKKILKSSLHNSHLTTQSQGAAGVWAWAPNNDWQK